MSKKYVRVTLDCGDEQRTKQSFRDQCDINALVERHRQTGLIDHTNHRQPLYGDFTQSTDLKTHLDEVNLAKSEFDSLSSSVRALCNHSPVKLLELLATEEGCDSLKEAGLFVTDEIPADVVAAKEAEGIPPSKADPVAAGDPPPIQGGE